MVGPSDAACPQTHWITQKNKKIIINIGILYNWVLTEYGPRQLVDPVKHTDLYCGLPRLRHNVCSV
jgi:hypothetical protein